MANYFRSIPSLTLVLVGVSYSAPLALAQAADDNCGQMDHCLSSLLPSSEPCLDGQDNSMTNAVILTDNVVMLSPHGSPMEQITGSMASAVAEFDGWNRYDFSDHGAAMRAYLSCG